MLPPYHPIDKKYSFDSTMLIEEINLLIENYVQERSLPFNNNKSVYDPHGYLKIAPDEQLNDTTRYILSDEGKTVVKGKFSTYHVFNLTYLEEEPDSLFDIYRQADLKKRIFWHTYKKPFLWRENLKNSEIKKAVEQFPWEYIQGVRLISMSPPSIGQIHRDSHPKSNFKYFSEGFASISFNIAHGGGILNYLDGENKQHSVDNSVGIFHFDDSVLHGVTPIVSKRYQLRIWGKLAVPYQSLLQQ
jgi:hypothetical protein